MSMKRKMIQREHKTTTENLLWLSVYTIELGGIDHSMKYETIQRCDDSKPEVEFKIARGEFNNTSYRLSKIKARILAIIMPKFQHKSSRS